jgi:hypothetical protein
MGALGSLLDGLLSGLFESALLVEVVHGLKVESHYYSSLLDILAPRGRAEVMYCLVDALTNCVALQDLVALLRVFDLDHHVYTHRHFFETPKIISQVDKGLNRLSWREALLEKHNFKTAVPENIEAAESPEATE